MQQLSINTVVSSNSQAITGSQNMQPSKEERFKRRLNFCIELLQMVEDSHQFKTPLSLPLLTSEQRKELIDKPEKILSIITNNWNQAEKFDSVVDLIQKISLILFKHGHKKHLTSRYSYKRIAAQCFKQFTHCFNSKLPSAQLLDKMGTFILSPAKQGLSNNTEIRDPNNTSPEKNLINDNLSVERSTSHVREASLGLTICSSTKTGSKDKEEEVETIPSFIEENHNIAFRDEDNIPSLDAETETESEDSDKETLRSIKRRRIITSSNSSQTSSCSNEETNTISSSTSVILSSRQSSGTPSTEIRTLLRSMGVGLTIIPFRFSFPFNTVEDIAKMLELKILLIEELSIKLKENKNLECSLSIENNELNINSRIKNFKNLALNYKKLTRNIINLFRYSKLPTLDVNQQNIVDTYRSSEFTILKSFKSSNKNLLTNLLEIYNRAINDIFPTPPSQTENSTPNLPNLKVDSVNIIKLDITLPPTNKDALIKIFSIKLHLLKTINNLFKNNRNLQSKISIYKSSIRITFSVNEISNLLRNKRKLFERNRYFELYRSIYKIDKSKTDNRTFEKEILDLLKEEQHIYDNAFHLTTATSMKNKIDSFLYIYTKACKLQAPNSTL